MADQNVLIVEDDPTWQNLFIEIIADAGFSATVVASVSEAEKALDFVAWLYEKGYVTNNKCNERAFKHFIKKVEESY